MTKYNKIKSIAISVASACIKFEYSGSLLSASLNSSWRICIFPFSFSCTELIQADLAGIMSIVQSAITDF
jgi:hypothetical protein